MAETKEKSKPINWNYVLVGGMTLGGIVLLWKLIEHLTASGGTVPPENRQQAQEILADWQNEFDEVHALMDRIYAEGRTPTDNEAQIISNFQDQMKWKELTIHDLDITTFEQLKELVWSIAKSLGVIVGTLLLAWVTIKLLSALIRKWWPPSPPNYPCPACDFVGATKSALNLHMRNQHTIQTANLAQAQYVFNQMPSAVQYYIADIAGSTSYATMDWVTANRDIIIAIGVAAGIALVCLVALPVAPVAAGQIAAFAALAFA